MTLSYAEAMKGNSKQATTGSFEPSTRSTVKEKGESNGAVHSGMPHVTVETATSTATTAWRKPTASTPFVWSRGLLPARDGAPLKHEAVKANPQPSNPWTKAPSNKATAKQANNLDKRTTKTKGNRQNISSNRKKSKSTASHPVRGVSVNNPGLNMKFQNDTKTNRKSISEKHKSSQTKPNLKPASINDTIFPCRKEKGAKSGESKTLQVASSTEFPALSASSQHGGRRKQTIGALPKRGKESGSNISKPPKMAAAKSSKASTEKLAKNEPGVAQHSVGLSSRSLASVFFKPQLQDRRPVDGDEHDLLRLMQERTVYQKKGRQRVAPRKKKFTSLKKKVLQERLKKWRELHPVDIDDSIRETGSPYTDRTGARKESCSVCLYDYASKDELDDDDEYSEIVDNLSNMAGKIGVVDQIHVPRNLDRSCKYPVFVKFRKRCDAVAAKACWNGLIVGGIALQVVEIDESSVENPSITGWVEKVLAAERSQSSLSSSNALEVGEDWNALEEAGGLVEVVVKDVLTEDDYADEESMEESLAYLEQVAKEFGDVLKVVPTDGVDGSALVLCGDSQSAVAISNGLATTIISGNPLSTLVQKSSSKAESRLSSVVTLNNLLTDDDIEDKDCLNETLNDIRELGGRYGEISSVVADGNAVKLVFSGSTLVAQKAADELDGLCVGGMVVSARVESRDVTTPTCIYLENVLTEDDFCDQECLEESLGDIRKIASKYGNIAGIEAIREGNSAVVKVLYGEGLAATKTAVNELNGMVVGGMVISASLVMPGESKEHNERHVEDMGVVSSHEGKRKPIDENGESLLKKARTGDKTPLYSGDKLIPEFFAECKRVPKIPNSGGARDYAKIVDDESVRPLLTEMLSELMRLQKRATDDKNAKARRRLVMGLREVARGIRAHKVKMVVMANNLDEYGAIDEKLQEIIELAHNEDVPLFFEFTKRSLGKAIGKSIKVAVIGIQNADGAHQAFKKLSSIASRI
eukprot:scaffold2243_cov122-Cylindrotheca_fusiformis.AAC.4